MSKRWLMWLGCGLMVAVGGYVLWSNGYQNILGYGMLLLCPLMHLFMHGGHGRGGHHGDPNATPNSDSGQTPDSKKPACH